MSRSFYVDLDSTDEFLDAPEIAYTDGTTLVGRIDALLVEHDCELGELAAELERRRGRSLRLGAPLDH